MVIFFFKRNGIIITLTLGGKIRRLYLVKEVDCGDEHQQKDDFQ